MLTAEEYKFVLTQECPEQSSKGAIDEETLAHKKWVKANEMVQYYILASMSNVLQHQHQSMPNAYNMMTSLR